MIYNQSFHTRKR